MDEGKTLEREWFDLLAGRLTLALTGAPTDDATRVMKVAVHRA
jgi:hypothetical protein